MIENQVILEASEMYYYSYENIVIKYVCLVAVLLEEIISFKRGRAGARRKSTISVDSISSSFILSILSVAKKRERGSIKCVMSLRWRRDGAFL